MKPVLTSLFLVLLAGCAGGGYTGYASLDLHEVTILLKPHGDATVEGTPKHGSIDFVRNLATAGITLLEMSFLQEDSLEIQNLLEKSAYPILLRFGEPRVTIQIEGLHWELRVQSGERTTGTALIINTTGETWSAGRVDLSDGNTIVATSSGSVSIPPEGAVFPWWEIDSAPPETLLVYGFPSQGRWNPLIAVPARETPPPLPEDYPGILRNDTLWLPAEHLLHTNLTWTRRTNGYNCFLELRSTADRVVQWRIILPARLPRGAFTEPGDGFTSRVFLNPGDTTHIRYSEIYPRGT
jgi:hypothetical protein